MVKAVIFDLDNTLYDENLYFKSVFNKFLKIHNIDFKLFENNFDDKFRLYSKDIFTDILKKINFYSKENQNQLFELYKSIDCNLKLYDEAYELINYLNNKSINIAIITNGVLEAQKNKVRVLDLEKITNKIVYAREFGKEFEKPHEKPYIQTLKLLSVKKEDVVFIGDHPYTDIIGATKVGIKALRFMNGYASNIEFLHNYNINSLLEVKNFLGENK
ncbi:HAD family hydrolase [Aliarcobacter cryaerophilus]|uniref:HAD family hydrolase n=1 Tax=Aliarcobacter cryaerophilus TaxID=28198 RepID=UPI0021B5D3A9|nr:HAD family hydrolase [Aliarcobacter cryaerophilus]MCT7519785.1 HAD family hydrolase [Aliarcobacter cryaerophilus]